MNITSPTAPPRTPSRTPPPSPPATTSGVIERGVWSEAEHAKFLDALKLHPKGPWKHIAVLVGTRSARQVQTHAQKYYEKIARHVRGLRKDRRRVARSEHRIDDVTVDFFKLEMSKDDSNSILSNADASVVGSTIASTIDAADIDDWVTHLESDGHLDWIDLAMCEGGDAAQMSDHDSDTLASTDTLMDFDDACLSYLSQILNSHEQKHML